MSNDIEGVSPLGYNNNTNVNQNDNGGIGYGEEAFDQRGHNEARNRGNQNYSGTAAESKDSWSEDKAAFIRRAKGYRRDGKLGILCRKEIKLQLTEDNRRDIIKKIKIKIMEAREMAVQTPSYWKEEKYQPLVEVETIYGNKVKIPKRFEEHWALYQRQKEIMVFYLKELVPDGYLAETSNPRKKWAVDLKKVFYELYGKNDPTELMLKEELLVPKTVKD